MTYSYRPSGVCSRGFEIDLEDGKIREVRAKGGCNGNLQGICRLLQGRTVESAINDLQGICCENKATSCPDQLAKALALALQESAAGQ